MNHMRLISLVESFDEIVGANSNTTVTIFSQILTDVRQKALLSQLDHLKNITEIQSRALHQRVTKPPPPKNKKPVTSYRTPTPPPSYHPKDASD